MDVCSCLRGQVGKNPEKTALFCDDEVMSYGALDRSSTELARWFLRQGLSRGDRVALHWSNSIEAVQLLFGIFKAGLIAVTVNTRLKPSEIGYILDHSGSRMCFSELALATGSEQAGAACPILTKLPPLEYVESPAALPALDPDQAAVILYTSGTTAHPKGVIHTHRSLYQTSVIADSWIMASEVGDTTVVLCVLPLMHAAALSGLIWSVCQGAPLVLLRRFEPAAVLDSIERFGCTALACMPALWSFVVEEQARLPRCVSSLRTAVSGGDTLPAPLQERFKVIFGLDLREVYGMTESVPVLSNPLGEVRAGSLGLPADGVQVRVVDLSGLDVADGQIGEILVRSSGKLRRVLGRSRSHSICPSGWVATNRRSGISRYGWILLVQGAQEGNHYPGWLQHFAARSGGGSVSAPGSAGSRRRRRIRSRIWRKGSCLCGDTPGTCDCGRIIAPICSAASGGVQSAGANLFSRPTAQSPYWEGAAARPQGDSCRADTPDASCSVAACGIHWRTSLGLR